MRRVTCAVPDRVSYHDGPGCLVDCRRGGAGGASQLVEKLYNLTGDRCIPECCSLVADDPTSACKSGRVSCGMCAEHLQEESVFPGIVSPSTTGMNKAVNPCCGT